jgi:hypothetical protein
VPWRVASPRLVCCQATAINTWRAQEWGRFTWPRQQWHHEFQQWRNNWSTVGRSVSRIYRRDWSSLTSSSRWEIAVVLGEFSVGDGVPVWLVKKRVSHESRSVKWRFYVECVIKWDCYNSCVLRSVARRRLVETGNPSACATVNCKVCKSAIALHCLCVRVIKSACVTNW